MEFDLSKEYVLISDPLFQLIPKINYFKKVIHLHLKK